MAALVRLGANDGADAPDALSERVYKREKPLGWAAEGGRNRFRER